MICSYRSARRPAAFRRRAPLLLAIALGALAPAWSRAQPVAPLMTWWTHTAVTNGMTPVRIAYYYGPRNPNAIGASGLMGFSNRNGQRIAGWQALAQPPQMNAFGAYHCAESTTDYSALLVPGERTYRCR